MYCAECQFCGWSANGRDASPAIITAGVRALTKSWADHTPSGRFADLQIPIADSGREGCQARVLLEMHILA
jgi:hypothetical protein